MPSFTAYPLKDAFVVSSYTAYSLKDAFITASSAAYPLKDAMSIYSHFRDSADTFSKWPMKLAAWLLKIFTSPVV